MMIAHSLIGEIFGPAQRLHGATYVVDATFRAATLDADGIVIDIGRASRALQEITASLSYRNLDDEPTLAGINTTTERLSQLIGDQLASQAREGVFRPAELTGITITLHESHIAWAAYEVEL
jgi:6-pyruvoyl-tetrahydropterin synthase